MMTESEYVDTRTELDACCPCPDVDCEERRFNDLSDDYAALSKKCDKYRAIVEELNECSAYWSDWEVPIGLRDRLREALNYDH